MYWSGDELFFSYTHTRTHTQTHTHTQTTGATLQTTIRWATTSRRSKRHQHRWCRVVPMVSSTEPMQTTNPAMHLRSVPPAPYYCPAIWRVAYSFSKASRTNRNSQPDTRAAKYSSGWGSHCKLTLKVYDLFLCHLCSRPSWKRHLVILHILHTHTHTYTLTYSPVASLSFVIAHSYLVGFPLRPFVLSALF